MLDEAIWDHSAFSANRERLLKESVMREFFGGVLAIAEWAQLVSDEHFSVDFSQPSWKPKLTMQFSTPC